jgi:hypothetical protein
VIYRGHIIAQDTNIFDIADIYGDRTGGQDFVDTRYQSFATTRPISIVFSGENREISGEF